MATNKQKLKDYMGCAARFLMEPYVYADNWGDQFTLDQYKQGCENFLNKIKEYLDWNDIDEETANILQFGIWSNNDPKFRLIPIYLYSIVPNGLKVHSFMGGTEIWNGKQDNDSRFGFLAYGIEVK